MTPGRTEERVLAEIVLAGLALSDVTPASRLTWLMEAVWVVVGPPQGFVPAILTREILLRRI